MIVLDLPPEAAALRRTGRSAGSLATGGDRIEDKGIEFQRRVALGFRRYAERAGGVRLIDGSRPPGEVAELVLAEVRRALD